jgi:hypothetical protein
MSFRKHFDENADGGTTGNSKSVWPETPLAESVEEQVQQVSLKEALKARGYSIDDELSDADIVDQLADAAAELASAPDKGEIEQFRAAQPVLADYAQNAAQYAEWKKAAEQEQQRQATETEEASRWEILEEDPSWNHLTRWDSEKNEWVASTPYGVQAAVDRNAYTRKFQTRARRLAAENPFHVIREAGFDDYMKQTREDIKQEIRRELEQEQAARSTQYALQQDIEENKTLLFQTDATGQVVRDNSGAPVRTEIGQAYANAVTVGQNDLGIADPGRLHRFAMMQVQPLLSQAKQPQEEQTKEEPQSTKKQTFVEKAKANGRRKTRDPEERATIARAAARSDAQASGKSWEELIKESEQELV